MRLLIRVFLPALLSFWIGFALASSGAFSTEKSLRPNDLIASPQGYLNRQVEVEILEPLSGPSTPEALAKVEYGKVRVDIPDSRFVDFSLVPPSFRMEDPLRYKKKFDRVLQGPLRVKGEFLSDEEISKSLRRPVYVIRVASWEPLGPEAPLRLSFSELQADPARFDRKRVVYEGVYEQGFEVSALDRDIWLSFERDTEVIGKPSEPSKGRSRNRVRVTGILYSKPGQHFGHLGGYKFEVSASKVEYLGPAPSPQN